MMNPALRATLPPGLYALCDDTVRPELSVVTKAELLLQGGVRVLQLRLKHTPLRAGLEAARAVVARCREAGAVCLVNDRVDVALLSGAHGAHVGDEDLPPEDARALLGPGRLLGVTVRGPEGAALAQAAGADYVGLGPVFATATKSVAAPVLGAEEFARRVAAIALPVVGIAGITLDNVPQVAAAGAHGAAVASAALCAPDVPARVRALVAAFDQAYTGRHARGTRS